MTQVDIAALQDDVLALKASAANPNTLTSFEGGNFGYQMVDATYAARCRFLIPTRTMRVNKALLHFSLQPFRSGAASGTSGGTSGLTSANHTHSFSYSTGTESGGHAHSVPGLGTPNHQHDLFRSGGTGTATGSNYTDGGGIVTQIWTVTGGTLQSYNMGAGTTGGGTSGGESTAHTHPAAALTVGQSVDHSHSIPGSALSTPNSLYETGMAQGCHVLIDGTDVTANLGGPWGTGTALDVHDLDVSQWLSAKGWHEVQISSTTIGGIFPSLAIFAVVGV